MKIEINITKKETIVFGKKLCIDCTKSKILFNIFGFSLEEELVYKISRRFINSEIFKNYSFDVGSKKDIDQKKQEMYGLVNENTNTEEWLKEYRLYLDRHYESKIKTIVKKIRLGIQIKEM